MGLIKFVFSLFFSYFIFKIVRSLFEPVLNSKPATNNNTNTERASSSTNNSTEKKSTIGEYIEYEEVK